MVSERSVLVAVEWGRVGRVGEHAAPLCARSALALGEPRRVVRRERVAVRARVLLAHRRVVRLGVVVRLVPALLAAIQRRRARGERAQWVARHGRLAGRDGELSGNERRRSLTLYTKQVDDGRVKESEQGAKAQRKMSFEWALRIFLRSSLLAMTPPNASQSVVQNLNMSGDACLHKHVNAFILIFLTPASFDARSQEVLAWPGTRCLVWRVVLRTRSDDDLQPHF